MDDTNGIKSIFPTGTPYDLAWQIAFDYSAFQARLDFAACCDSVNNPEQAIIDDALHIFQGGVVFNGFKGYLMSIVNDAGIQESLRYAAQQLHDRMKAYSNKYHLPETELVRPFVNPYNSGEMIYKGKPNNRYYSLQQGQEPYYQVLASCTAHGGFYEADGPVPTGSIYIIDNKRVYVEENGWIIDHVARIQYENELMEFYQVLPGFEDYDENYKALELKGRLLVDLYDYLNPQHFMRVSIRRGDVVQLLGNWFERKSKTSTKIGELQ